MRFTATGTTLPLFLALFSGRASAFVMAPTATGTAGRRSSVANTARVALWASSSRQPVTAATENVDAVAVKGPDLPPVASMSKRLFLVRHGEVINPGGDRPVYYGAQDVPLSPLGEEEANAAALYLKQFDLQHVASSPLSRAVFGAQKVLEMQQSKQADMLVYKGFTELDRGAWCGLTMAEIGPKNMDRFDACDESVTPKGGESYPTLKARVLQARDELLDRTDCGKACALVSHLQVTRSMLSDAMGMSTHEMAGLKVATASVTCIDYDIVTGDQTVHFQSFKPDVGLKASNDGAN